MSNRITSFLSKLFFPIFLRSQYQMDSSYSSEELPLRNSPSSREEGLRFKIMPIPPPLHYYDKERRTYLLGVGRRYGEGGVYPAVCVDDVGGNVTTVDAVDGITHILLGGDHDAEGQQHQDGERVVQSEHFIVDVGSGYLHEALEAPKDIQHDRVGLPQPIIDSGS
ncbi:hypothetical protein CEXT_490971 [Caerostris extrusa]|uniref:Uncharacterized protein n=1 Tax=Caerostris extrusa TaxID=172846 RepID=A0AAV4XKL1_CAEEX|nr:hypothetical protein CEXT_490971 [Caerostris extrusa]